MIYYPKLMSNLNTFAVELAGLLGMPQEAQPPYYWDIDGHAVSIILAGEDTATKCTVEVEVTTLPQSIPFALQQQLLQGNFLFGRSAGTVLGINDRNTVVLSVQIAENDIASAEELQQIVENMLNNADYWQECCEKALADQSDAPSESPEEPLSPMLMGFQRV